MKRIFALIVMVVLLGGCAHWALQKEKNLSNDQSDFLAEKYHIIYLEDYNNAILEMKKIDYQQGSEYFDPTGYYRNDEINALLWYLADRENAGKNSLPVIEVRNKRLKLEKEEKLKVAAEQAKAKQQRKEGHPFTAILTCNYSGKTIPYTGTCFIGGDKNFETALELRNGSDYHLYKHFEFDTGYNGRQPLDSERDEAGVQIYLDNNFEITARNSQSDYILNLKIVTTDTQEVVFEKSVGQYGVISVRN